MKKPNNISCIEYYHDNGLTKLVLKYTFSNSLGVFMKVVILRCFSEYSCLSCVSWYPCVTSAIK